MALDDCGYYVRWLFDHPRLANGMNLETAIGDITYTELAAAFEKVTGHPRDTSTPISRTIGAAHSTGSPICPPVTTPTQTTRAP